MSVLSARGPHDVLRGNLGIAGQPGVVFTPETGKDLPAVAFGHGWLTRPDRYRGLLEHLASWGLVVAAPDTEHGPIPSHLGLATDLLTTLDICSGVRLGDGTITVHPDRLGLAGHGMGAGAAVLAAGQRRVAGVAALFPAVTSPSAAASAPEISAPGLIVAGEQLDSTTCDAREVAAAWGGTAVLRQLPGAANGGIVEGRSVLTALGGDKYHRKTDRTVRGLLTGYLLFTLTGDKKYAAFGDADSSIPGTHVVDPHEVVEDEDDKSKPSIGQARQLVKLLRS